MNTQNTTPTRKILVVDDDPRLRDLLRRYLSEQGFNVFVAEDAKRWANSGNASISTCSCWI